MVAPERFDRYAPFRWTRLDVAKHVEDSARLARVYRRWQEDRSAADMPRWQISLLETMPAETLPFVNVIDVNGGQPPFRYRFFGSGLANMHLFELTNRTTSAIEPPGFRFLCEDEHLMTIESREPMLFVNEVPTKAENLSMSHLMLRLPYSGDGRSVSHVLTVEETLGEPAEVWERFRQLSA